MLVGFPPESDVYYFLSQAAQVLLSGGNPYVHTYTGIPSGLLTPGAQQVFAYLPFSAVYSVPFFMAGDVRYGLALGDLVVGGCLYLYGGRWRSSAAAVFLLLPPLWLFSTVYPNVAVISMVFIALFFLLDSRGRGVAAAACIGIAAATVQFSLLMMPAVLYYFARTRRWTEALVSVGVALLVVAPFLAASPSAFISETVSFQLSRTVLPLVGSGPPVGFTLNPSADAVALAATGAAVPAYARAVAALVTVVFTLRATSLRYVARNTAILIGVSSFVLPTDFFWAYLELPFMLALFWLVSPSEGPRVKNLRPDVPKT
jgi:hypothetical protein